MARAGRYTLGRQTVKITIRSSALYRRNITAHFAELANSQDMLVGLAVTPFLIASIRQALDYSCLDGT
jgi:hypothetical protein